MDTARLASASETPWIATQHNRTHTHTQHTLHTLYTTHSLHTLYTTNLHTLHTHTLTHNKRPPRVCRTQGHFFTRVSRIAELSLFFYLMCFREFSIRLPNSSSCPSTAIRPVSIQLLLLSSLMRLRLIYPHVFQILVHCNITNITYHFYIENNPFLYQNWILYFWKSFQKCQQKV